MKKPAKAKKQASKPIQMQMEGYEIIEKKAEKGGNSGRIYVPKHWVGKKVRVVLTE